MLAVMKPQRGPGAKTEVLVYLQMLLLEIGWVLSFFFLCKGLVPRAKMLNELVQAHITSPALVCELNVCKLSPCEYLEKFNFLNNHVQRCNQ